MRMIYVRYLRDDDAYLDGVYWSLNPKIVYIKNNAWVTMNKDFWVTSVAICQ